MSSYYVPNTVSISPRESPNQHQEESPKESFGRSARESQSDSIASIEYGRGSGIALPSHLLNRGLPQAPRPQRGSPPVYQEPQPPTPGKYPCLKKYEQPMEERCRIPGCGINHYDPFDEPVAAYTSPLRWDDLFPNNIPKKTYGRAAGSANQKATDFLPRFHPNNVAQILSTAPIRDPRYPIAPGNLSPLVLSFSSSSSDSSPLSYSEFRPLASSEHIYRTPPQVRRSHRHRLHPRYYPSESPSPAREFASESIARESPSSPSTTYSGECVCETDEDVYLPESPIPRGKSITYP